MDRQRPATFLRERPVFRHEEFVEACYPALKSGVRTAERTLDYHCRKGGLLRVRRGLYANVPNGLEKSTFHPNSLLVASKVAPDAVLAYHTALEYHGCAYSLRNDRAVLTQARATAFEFQGIHYRPIPFPRSLQNARKRLLGVESRDLDGLPVLVTNVERTLVDLLDRPDLSGGWEEIWRCFENVGFVDPELIVRHVENLRNATTAARVGWFLEEHREAWMLPETLLARLQKLSPASPRYLLRSSRESGRLLPRWNLIVPQSVRDRQWEQVL